MIRPFISSLLLFIFWSLSAHEHSSGIKFIENKGQWPSQVKYKANIPGGALYAEQNCLTYNFHDAQFLEDAHHQKFSPGAKSPQAKNVAPPSQALKIRMHAFRMRPLGGDCRQMVSEHKFTEQYNYFLGDDPSHWASGVSAYEEILYRNIYPGSDMRIYPAENGIKYEFILAPGASPHSIRLKYEGLKNIYLKEGNLILETTVNLITEQAPYIYQTVDGRTIPVEGQFVLRDSVVSFRITGKYNRAYPLIIDPQLIFSTYSGSTADNWGNTAAFDENGNMYSGGTVFDAGYPTTIGAYQRIFGGQIDVGIMKYNPTGTTLLYGTYLGGMFADVPYSLVVNSSNELVIMGTSSGNFPTTLSAFDRTFNGGTILSGVYGITFENGTDLFVAKLNSGGTSLLAATYIGGSSNDGIQQYYDYTTANYGDEMRGDVITDDLNNIYICASSYSGNFPVSAGAAQTSFGGTKDAVVAKFNTNLSSRIWSTYIGGIDEDIAYSIQIDSLDHVYVAGGTRSSDFPVTAGALHTARQGSTDGFVTHIASNGGSFLQSTFIGTPSYDQAYFIQLDTDENVYLLGQTTGNYPVTSGTYNNPNSGQFIHGLSHDLSTTRFSTVIGTGGNYPNISLTAFLVNECGNIFLSGWGGNTNSNYFPGSSTNNLPVTSDAYRGLSDGSDFYIMVLGPDAQSFLYGTFFGSYNGSSDHVDGGTSRFDKRGIIYEAVCAGCGGSDAFPTTPGAYSRDNRSDNCNNAAFKFDLSSLEANFIATKSCSQTMVTILNTSLGGRTFTWDFGDGTFSNLHSPGTHTYTSSGTYTIQLIITDVTTCISSDTADTTIFVPPVMVVNYNTDDTTICPGDTVQLVATCDPGYNYRWTPPKGLSSDTICNPLAFPVENTDYTVVVRDTNGCMVQKMIRVRAPLLHHEINYTNDSDCSGKVGGIFQNNSMGVKFNWFFSDGTSELNTDNMVEHTFPAPGTYTIILEASSGGCSVNDTLSITLDEIFFPNLLTPNDDGKNEVYEIKGAGENWGFEVYNRWGDAVYKNSNYQNDWSPEKLADGVYYYLITSPNKVRCKGWVEVVR